MTTYKFKATTTFLIIVRLTLTLVIVLGVFALVLKFGILGKINNEFLFLGFFSLVSFLIYYLLRRITVIDISINLEDKNKIEILSENIIFRKRKYVFLFSEIKYYSFENGSGYKIFCLKRNRGGNFKFLIFYTIENLGLFNKFFKEFKNIIESQNSAPPLSTGYEKPTIYKTKLGLVYGVLIFLILIAIPIAHIIFKTRFNIGFLLILYPPSLFFLMRLYLEQRNKTK
ncbi:hypothetical protein [Flavobacterium nitrogenifigens]|uniref:Uncharacterized protein n=1 Tax=Flavobacterium nitrogenifigens TaxID=1617283 RepID=A0A521FDL0_9FLAO|nr:hypothetical protein [Flavobacterium nitrogenifigens]KAF2338859.1 hypothetical protein DM397_02710 [Flavobacterium nitrogenifigens]SMO94233.1 hypothetical protein SAMN06265220_11013 [Flavobacterium nitrogenifigens]